MSSQIIKQSKKIFKLENENVEYDSAEIYKLLKLKNEASVELINALSKSDISISWVMEKLSVIKNLSPKTKNSILKLAAKLLNAKSDRDDDLARSIFDIIFSLPFDQSALIPDILTVQEILDTQIYGMENAKNFILRQVAVNILNPESKPKPLLLQGNPGVGKTFFCKVLAKALERSYYTIPVGAVDGRIIKGYDKVYIGADIGLIMRSIHETNINNPLIILDEIDKIGSFGNGATIPVLLEILDPNQNEEFKDPFLDIEFDISRVWFVATSNSLKNISAPVLDRLTVLELPDYTKEDKQHIFNKFILPKCLRENGLSEFKVEFTLDAKEYLFESFNKPGVRDVDQKISNICGGVALDIVKSKIDPKSKIEIDLKKVKEYEIISQSPKNTIGFKLE